jgi:putative peptidoglycan lipid II flippase
LSKALNAILSDFSDFTLRVLLTAVRKFSRILAFLAVILRSCRSFLIARLMIGILVISISDLLYSRQQALGYNKQAMGKIWTFVARKQNSLGSAAIILMLMVISSGLLGLVRYRVLNGIFTPDQTGIFLAAFRLPNLLFEILAMGALTSAFIPVYTKFITKNRNDDAQKMASIVINITVIILTIIAIPIMIWSKQISKMFAPGFTDSQIEQMAMYTRIMVILQVIPLIVGNFFTGILQSSNLFIVPALAPIVYNAGMIIGILIFSSTFGLFSAVIGVGIGAISFMLIQIPMVLKVGYKHHFLLNHKQPGVAEVGKLIVPRMIGLGASQIDVTVDLIMASLMGPRMVTVFYLAQSLQQLPIRLFGATISQAALPTLSAASAREDLTEFKKSVISAYNMILFLMFPSTILFLILRVPVVRLVFGASRFDWDATVMTALTLSAFAISMPAQALSQVFTRGFYALYDSRTPVIISVISILINSAFSMLFILVFHFPIWSLGLSTTIASILNAGALIIIFQQKVHFHYKDLFIEPAKMFLAALLSGLIIYIPMKLFDQLVFDTTRVFGLVMLTSIAGGLGIINYLFICWVMGIEQVNSALRILDRVRHLRTLFIEPAEELVNGEMTNR